MFFGNLIENFFMVTKCEIEYKKINGNVNII